MPINKNELAQEMIQKALQCNSAEDLIAYAKSEGLDITKDEAEAYMAELADCELAGEQLTKVAGGGCYPDCPKDYCFEN